MRIFTILFALLLVSSTAFAQVSDSEKNALIDLYTATDGDNWNTPWDINTPVKNWHGVTVENNRVIALNLMFNNLKGELPESITSLTYLENLELSFNQLEGTLPSTLEKLENLKTLAINSNQLNGTIPSGIGALVNLENLHLSSNNLTGVIPASIGNLNELEVFNVFDNSLSGVIPHGLTNATNLQKLVVAENDIIITDAVTEVRLFEVDNENTRFKTPSTFINKTVLAIETSDDEE